MILYYYEACPFCQKVLNIIHKLNLSTKVELRDTSENPSFRQELIDLNGKTQVPCLVIDGKPMLESNDIIAYLQQHFG